MRDLFRAKKLLVGHAAIALGRSPHRDRSTFGMATHWHGVRSYERGKATTLTEHMPKAHQKYVGRTPSRLIEDAQQIGPCTGQLVEAILAAKRHPEMGYRSCVGILRLAKTYPAERMEAASRRALRARAYNFQSMDSILRNQLDRSA
jgi:transposase